MERFCGDCGSELTNGVCPICSQNQQVTYTQIEEMNQNVENVDYQNKSTATKQSKGKKTIVAVLIVLGLLIIGGVIVAWFHFFKGRDIEKTIEIYEEAKKEQDEELLLEIMFPKDSIDSDLLDDYEDEIDEGFDYMDEENVHIISINIENTSEVDNKTSDEIKEMFSEELEMKAEYNECKILTLEIKYRQDGEEETGEEDLFAYLVDDKWYVYPGLLEYLDNLHQTNDYQTAKSIAFAVENAIFDEDINTMMNPYLDTVISVEEDLTYLPEEFCNTFNNYLNQKSDELFKPQITYTKNGAAGYAFKLDSDGNIIVYISSERKVDEWQIYPTTDENYYSDDKIEVDETTVQTEESSGYKYVQLVSHKSPLLGYWQSDEAGMYIGYNTTEYKEGLIVYVYTGGADVYLLNAKTGWSISGDSEHIVFENEKAGVKADMVINDASNIKLSGNFFGNYGDLYHFGDESREFVFEKGEIDSSVTDLFVGDWKECFREDSTYTISYDGKFGYQNGDRKSYGEQVEEDGVIKMPQIVMYDGNDCLAFVNPFTENQYSQDSETKYSFELLAFELREEGDMVCAIEHSSIVYPLSWYCYKEGSSQEEFWEAMYAYEELANTQTDYKQVSLIYLDDNDMPELILWEKGELYTYANGQTVKIDCQELTYIAGDVTGTFEYNPRSGRFSTHRHPSTYYFIYDGISVETKYFYSSFFQEGPRAFTGENLDVGLEEDAFQQGLLDDGFSDMIQPERYNSVFDAYSNMEGALIFY